MYGGKHIAEGDVVFLFASENEGGQGLVARGIVTSADAVPKRLELERQTPRVSVSIRRTALASGRLGRDELKRVSVALPEYSSIAQYGKAGFQTRRTMVPITFTRARAAVSADRLSMSAGG